MVGCEGSPNVILATLEMRVASHCPDPHLQPLLADLLVEVTVAACLYLHAELVFDLSGVDLSGANLKGANLEGANLENANLTWVSWFRTTCPDGTNSNDSGDTCCENLNDAVPSTGCDSTIFGGIPGFDRPRRSWTTKCGALDR